MKADSESMLILTIHDNIIICSLNMSYKSLLFTDIKKMLFIKEFVSNPDLICNF